jgi:LysM repeat protein
LEKDRPFGRKGVEMNSSKVKHLFRQLPGTVLLALALNSTPGLSPVLSAVAAAPPSALQAVPNQDEQPIYPIRYTVQRGDTLSAIARRFDTTVMALMEVNNLASTRIYIGQQLVIPVAAPPDQPVIYHTVVRGDTLSGIARQYGSTVAAIKAANGLTSNTIYVGQRLLIPTGTGTPTEPSGAQRIRFAPGAVSATVSGSVQSVERDSYVLRALAGQQMRIELISSDGSAGFSLQGLTDGQPYKRIEVAGSVFEMTLPMTQDYLIRVGLPAESGSVSYELYVEVLPAQTTAPQRIQFAPGTTSATVAGSVIRGERMRYILGARAGQTMLVNISAVENNAVFTITRPDGSALSGAAEGQDARSWTGTLPLNGDYVISVGPTRGNATFNLAITIY